MTLRQGEQRLYKLSVQNLKDVVYECDDDGEVLRCHLTDKETISLRLRPEISTVQSIPFET